MVVGFVHRIDTDRHPTLQGWRWAVHLSANPYDLSKCMQAGQAPDEATARLEAGWFVAAVVNTVAAVSGRAPEYRISLLDHDPIPEGGDRVKLV